MLFIEDIKGRLTDEQLAGLVRETLRGFRSIKKILLIHPDYTRCPLFIES